MSETKKIAYLVAALETTQAEISGAAATLKNAADSSQLFAKRLEDSALKNYQELERRLVVGTEQLKKEIKEEQKAISKLSLKSLIKIVGVSVGCGLVVAGAVTAYSMFIFSSLKGAREELAMLRAEAEQIQTAGVRAIDVQGARRAFIFPQGKWESMRTEKNETIIFIR